MDQLLELPGIGRKSANVILGAAYGIASGIVVDTHMIRLTNRFRLTTSEDPVKIEQDLIKVIPRKSWIYFSQAMVLHGRYICLAKNPRCWECHLIKSCPYADKVLSPKITEKTGVRRTITGELIRIRT
jgi:endonuclease-3